MTSETRSFYLQHEGDRRFRMVSVLIVQVFVYLMFIGMVATGAIELVNGNTGEGAGILVLGLVGLGAGVLFIAAIAKFECKPRIWVDLGAKTITYRHLIGDVLPFAEAAQMRRSRNQFSIYWLVGPRTDMTGRINPRGRFGYATGFSTRGRNGGRHFLADLLPAPFAGMSDDLMIVDELTWDDAIRFAMFLNLRNLWNAGHTSISASGRAGDPRPK